MLISVGVTMLVACLCRIRHCRSATSSDDDEDYEEAPIFIHHRSDVGDPPFVPHTSPHLINKVRR